MSYLLSDAWCICCNQMLNCTAKVQFFFGKLPNPNKKNSKKTQILCQSNKMPYLRAMKGKSITIIDFGSQYTQLIARRVREQHVYCQIEPPDISLTAIRALRPEGIILSDGPVEYLQQGGARDWELSCISTGSIPRSELTNRFPKLALGFIPVMDINENALPKNNWMVHPCHRNFFRRL